MPRTPFPPRPALALLAVALAGAAHAQGPSEFSDCQSISDQDARYACYDQVEINNTQGTEHDSPPGPPSRNADPIAEAGRDSPPVLAPGSHSPEEVTSFGTDPASDARLVENGEGRQELHDRIAHLREREPGKWLITLESGQVWYQTNSKRMRFQAGMQVRIYPSPLGGSYRLSASDLNGFIQVHRVE